MSRQGRTDGARLRTEAAVLLAAYLRAGLGIDRQRDARPGCDGKQRIDRRHQVGDVFQPVLRQIWAVPPWADNVTWTDHLLVPGRGTAGSPPDRQKRPPRHRLLPG